MEFLTSPISGRHKGSRSTYLTTIFFAAALATTLCLCGLSELKIPWPNKNPSRLLAQAGAGPMGLDALCTPQRDYSCQYPNKDREGKECGQGMQLASSQVRGHCVSSYTAQTDQVLNTDNQWQSPQPAPIPTQAQSQQFGAPGSSPLYASPIDNDSLSAPGQQPTISTLSTIPDPGSALKVDTLLVQPNPMREIKPFNSLSYNPALQPIPTNPSQWQNFAPFYAAPQPQVYTAPYTALSPSPYESAVTFNNTPLTTLDQNINPQGAPDYTLAPTFEAKQPTFYSTIPSQPTISPSVSSNAFNVPQRVAPIAPAPAFWSTISEFLSNIF